MKDVMIWPIYLDAGKSLNEGRKISKEYAVSEPRIKEIVKATQKLRYKYYAEEDKAYPGEWYNKSGRDIITSDDVFDYVMNMRYLLIQHVVEKSLNMKISISIITKKC